jgi:hypothetical protein
MALAACTHSGHAPAALASSSGVTPSLGGPAGSSSSVSTSRAPLTGATTSGKPRSTGSRPAPRVSSTRPPAALAPPGGSDLSGVICDYVSRSDVNAILSGTSAGQENDLASVAISYCAFHTSTGTVTVGVKNLDMSSTATAQVRGKYGEMSGEPDQSLQTFQAAGEFAFEVGSTTPLQNGDDLYAMNAQGSRGGWYVTIQYYAHTPCTSGAMQHLLATVLSKVPNSP